MSRVDSPFPLFAGLDNRLLDNGYVWFGVENEDPETDPIAVFADAAMTVPVAQPLRTKAGLLSDGDAPVNAYIDGPYSIRVRSFIGVEVIYRASVPPSDATDASLVSYDGTTVEATLDAQAAKLAKTVYVTDPPYNAVGDGVADDSAAIMAAIDANKGGTIVFPAGKTFLAAGTILSGSSYDGTHLIVEGTYLLKPSGGSTNFGGTSPFYGGIVVHDCDGVSVDVPGLMNGNRAAQVDNEQIHLLVFWGATNFEVPQFNAAELRGDGIYISSKTNLSPLTKNSKNGVIGPVKVINSADDGRNAISLVSGENITLAGGISIKQGGTIASNRMPGGLDIEVDGNWHLVKNIKSGPWYVETAGTSGVAVIGVAITNDTTRDWNVEDVSIAPSTVVATASGIGGPLFKRLRRLDADVTLIRTGGRAVGIDIDYADFVSLRAKSKGCSNAVTVGFANFVNDFQIDIAVEDHSAAGLLCVGAARGQFTGYVRGGQGAGSYGVQLSDAGRGTVNQSAVTYSVNIPYDSNNSFAFFCNSGINPTDGTSVANCTFGGYPNFATMFTLGAALRSRNVAGRNNATAVPANGAWVAGDVVLNDSVAAGGAPGWVCTTTGTFGGTPPVFKAMANVAA